MIKTGTAVNKIEFFDGSTFRMRENYDLGGLLVRSISLPWAPFLIQTNCKADTLECDNDGYLIDFMNMATNLFNFTYISYKEESISSDRNIGRGPSRYDVHTEGGREIPRI